MNYNSDEQRALIVVERKIEKALEENDARKVFHYFMVKEYIETNKLIRRLLELNPRDNAIVASFLSIKLHLIEAEMNLYESEEPEN